MSDGTREARTAAQWWADHLTAANEPTTGDPKLDIFVTYAQSMLLRPTPEQVETFRAHLEAAIIAMINDPANGWVDALRTGEPRGAAFRKLTVDYKADRILSDSMAAAGIRAMLLLPMKTSMWISPGIVEVGHGYNAPRADVELVDG